MCFINGISWICRLFKYVKVEPLQSPTFQALMAMYNDFTPDSNQAEQQPADFGAHRDAFLDAVFQTPLFQHAYTFLVNQGNQLSSVLI